MQTPGDRIRAAREAKIIHGKRMTQTQLAQATETSLRSIIDWEQGKRPPKTANLQAIAKALGVEFDYLLNGSPDEDADAALLRATAERLGDEIAVALLSALSGVKVSA